MLPTLDLNGRLAAGVAVLLVVVGALRALWPLVFLGATVVAVLGVAYLVFLPTAMLLGDRHLEMAWWIPHAADPRGGPGAYGVEGSAPTGALLAGRPFPLRVLLRSRAPRTLGDAELEVLASPALTVDGPLRVRLPRATEVELAAEVTARAVGYWFLHGAALRLGDTFGLFVIRAYFPNPLGLKVYPRLAGAAAVPGLSPRLAALDERAGLHRIRLRGLGGELREIRDHAHGDPFKQIAWKATARTRRLMVRELEREIVVTHQLLVDISPTMRAGDYGRAKLDYAVELCAALARVAGESGDRVGLITFDGRIHGHLRPGEGRPHQQRLLERLMELRAVVDEDLTDPTDGELCALVARHLRHQEGIDVRVPYVPPLDDPRWADIATGPAGELYDLEVLDRVVTVFLGAVRESAAGLPVRAQTAPMARLRRFCRLRGVELPYRRGPGRKARGLAEALLLAARPRGSQLLLLVSDLDGLGDDLGAVLRAVRLARAHHHRLLVVAPFAPGFALVPDTEHARRVAAILTRAERRAFEGPRRLLGQLGVPVIVVGRDDSPQVVLGRWQRLRGAQRRGVAA